jgi:pyridoxine 5-phosphate synthase
MIFVLDALVALRETTANNEIDLGAAATLAELAGVDAIRLGVDDHPTAEDERQLLDARRAARRLELRMGASPGLLKLALEVRPDHVLLAGSARDGSWSGGVLDLLTQSAPLGPVLRGFEEAGIPASLRIAPKLEAVKAAHSEGASGVELFTASILDLPATEREVELEALGDAVRLAAKLRMRVGISGGLGYRELPDLLGRAPAIEWVAVGRAAVARSLLIGMDRALRDLLVLVR